MNNLDLVEKLRFCPEGTKFYSPIYGVVTFNRIEINWDYPIRLNSEDTKDIKNDEASFTSDGKHLIGYKDSEVTLFPSKDNHDWSTVDWSRKDLPVDTPVLVTDYMTNKCESGKCKVFIDSVHLRLYAGSSKTFNDSGSWNHIIPLDRYHIEGNYVVFKPEDDYGTEAYKSNTEC